jgi:outer membrane protein OmpA-like peptidoglycan-associated protein
MIFSGTTFRSFTLIGSLLIGLSTGMTPEGLPGLFSMPSAHTLGHGVITAGASASFHADNELLLDGVFQGTILDTAGKVDSTIVNDLQSATFRFHLSLGLSDFFDMGVSVPIHGDLIADTRAEALSGFAVGDVKILAKLRAPFPGRDVFSLAVLGGFAIPSKQESGFLPKSSTYINSDSGHINTDRFSSHSFQAEYGMAASLDFTKMENSLPFRFQTSGGILQAGSVLGGDRIKAGGGVAWVPLPYLGFFGELEALRRIKSPLGREPTRFLGEDARINAGLSLASAEGFTLDVGLQFRISGKNYAEFEIPLEGEIKSYQAGTVPAFSIGGRLGWSGALVSPDSDQDGIRDRQDLCPDEKEDRDGFQDDDGCLDADNDADGVPDLQDKCPGEKEDLDGFQDDDGCLDPDNDGDTVLDGADRCPAEAEDLDGFEDQDGCPELDNDGDGVMDVSDKCPNQPEDKDGFDDADGCPDIDNDADKIPDLQDQCPNEPETINGFEDGDGCPDTLSQDGRSLPGNFPEKIILSKTRFSLNSSTLSAMTYAELDSVAALLTASPTTRVEVRVYWDNQGKDLTLLHNTQSLAESMRKHLILKGVSHQRIEAKGMGAADPVSSNHSAAGRSRNRRAEIIKLQD